MEDKSALLRQLEAILNSQKAGKEICIGDWCADGALSVDLGDIDIAMDMCRDLVTTAPAIAIAEPEMLKGHAEVAEVVLRLYVDHNEPFAEKDLVDYFIAIRSCVVISKTLVSYLMKCGIGCRHEITEKYGISPKLLVDLGLENTFEYKKLVLDEDFSI